MMYLLNISTTFPLYSWMTANKYQVIMFYSLSPTEVDEICKVAIKGHFQIDESLSDDTHKSFVNGVLAKCSVLSVIYERGLSTGDILLSKNFGELTDEDMLDAFGFIPREKLRGKLRGKNTSLRYTDLGAELSISTYTILLEEEGFVGKSGNTSGTYEKDGNIWMWSKVEEDGEFKHFDLEWLTNF